ncbi:MAG: ergothioneine biosynthesis protein EgtB, partial [Polyangiales bacterium]
MQSPSSLREGQLEARYRAVRAQTVALAAPLSPEDMQVQSMPDASPTKWHLAHTTWFFETFVLARALGGEAAHRPFDPAYALLFNSYYEAVGPRHPRPSRGLLTRPDAKEVARYRAAIDARMLELLRAGVDDATRAIVELGLHHEQQHQELILTDVQHVLSLSPLRPAYRQPRPAGSIAPLSARKPSFFAHRGGDVEIGHGGDEFAFDNETPRHVAHLEPFEIASRPVTCGEYLAFIRDGGYERPGLWLSDGWAAVQANGWRAPLYWEPAEAAQTFRAFTLEGLRALDLEAPVSHVSHFEADAYAHWAGARLPT